MKLIDGWRRGHKFLSVQANMMTLGVLGAWGAMPAKFQDAIPVTWVQVIAAVLIIAGTVGRFFQQSNTTPPREEPPQ